jgi:hypothetical protein
VPRPETAHRIKYSGLSRLNVKRGETFSQIFLDKMSGVQEEVKNCATDLPFQQ